MAHKHVLRCIISNCSECALHACRGKGDLRTGIGDNIAYIFILHRLKQTAR